MSHFTRTSIALAGAVLITSLAGSAALSGSPTSSDTRWKAETFSQAKALAASTSRPVLIEVAATGCQYCKNFEAAASGETEVQKALATNVVLLATNADKGEGQDIVRMYSVGQHFPSFLLVNANGDLMDRWAGYYKPEDFVTNLSSAVANPLPVADRRARFRQSPNELDARKFGELAEYAGQFAEATAYYHRAAQLNPKSETNYDMLALNAMGRGVETGLFTMDEVRGQADVIVNASNTAPMDYLKVAFTMGKIARLEHNLTSYVPYLQAAVERTAGTQDEMVQGKRGKLLPDYALHVEKDAGKAVKLQKTQFTSWDAKWMEDANQLNNFAWWCFENQINLDEADKLARKGVELAEPGVAKANILDTAAEICNLKGNCDEAVQLIQLAVAEAPENEYFRKQLDRFEQALALSESRSR